MREAKNQDEIVSARLRVVLAATDHGVRDQPIPPVPIPPVPIPPVPIPAVPIPPVPIPAIPPSPAPPSPQPLVPAPPSTVPPVPVPPLPGLPVPAADVPAADVLAADVLAASTPEPPVFADFADLSPLKWSDIVPSWPDDLDFDPHDGRPALPPPADGEASSSTGSETGPVLAAASSTAQPSIAPRLASPFPAAGEPATPDRVPLEADSMTLESLAARPPLPSPDLLHHSPLHRGPAHIGVRPRLAAPPRIRPAPALGEASSSRTSSREAVDRPTTWADAATTALPITPERTAADSGMPQWTFEDDDESAEPSPALTAAGAFDSGLRRSGTRRSETSRPGTGTTERGGRLLAFDPGRRGVKALAAVAAAVVLIAAFLAWRARPRIDPVAVPPVEVAAAAAGRSDGGRSDGPAGAVPPTGRAGASGGVQVVVAVGGKVRKPGLVRLPPGSRVADALQAAGGANPGIDVALLNLARKVVDGELILVGVTPPPGAAAPNAGGAPAAGGAGAPAGGPVNLNTATLADLDGLPGVGPVLAQRILAARDAQGGFKAVSDLRKVDGIGDARYEQLKDLVVV